MERQPEEPGGQPRRRIEGDQPLGPFGLCENTRGIVFFNGLQNGIAHQFDERFHG